MTDNTPARMGQYARNDKYKPNLNTFINGLYAPRYVFPQSSAVIVGTKEYPDVSFYQGDIDWDAMRSKTDTVIIRAGQNEWIDEKFFENWKAAGQRDMLRAAYWFYDGRKSPGFQADLFASLVRGDPAEMELIVDWERSYNGAHEGLPNVVAMMQRLESLLPGTVTMIYTGYYWFIANSNPIIHRTQYNYLQTRPLHLAYYTSNPASVKIPPPWSELLLWQYGTPVVDYGQESIEIDMNRVNLTNADFYERYGGEVPPEPPDEGDTMYQCTVKASATPYVNLRASDNSGSQDIGNVPPSTPFQADTLTNGYLHSITTPYVGYISAAYCDYELVTDPEPTTSPVVYTAVETDLTAKTIAYTRRRKDGTIEVIQDPIE
jgi:GH25 family lysozyme M1 (1,4-beta-N-acetylmuramidase)